LTKEEKEVKNHKQQIEEIRETLDKLSFQVWCLEQDLPQDQEETPIAVPPNPPSTPPKTTTPSSGHYEIDR
jgi:hypothetical protein